MRFIFEWLLFFFSETSSYVEWYHAFQIITSSIHFCKSLDSSHIMSELCVVPFLDKCMWCYLLKVWSSLSFVMLPLLPRCPVHLHSICFCRSVAQSEADLEVLKAVEWIDKVTHSYCQFYGSVIAA